MAGVLGFESLEINVGGVAGSTIDLLGNPGIDKSACGFTLLEAGGGRAWAIDEGGPVTDTFTLRCSGSNVVEQENQLRYILDLAKNQRTGVNRNTVYLRARSAHDTEEMQTVIIGGALQEQEPVYNYISARHKLDRFMLQVQHMPAWERISTGASGVTISNVAPTATPTDLFSLPQNRLEGDLPARVREFRWERTTSGSDVKEAWIGWRSNRDNDDYDAPVHFWDLKDPAAYSNNTTDSSSASATSGCAAIWTPAGGGDDDLLRRATISAESALGTSVAQTALGEYHLLLRARATGTATFYVRVSTGNTTSGVFSSGTRFLVDSAFFKLYSIGSVQLPAEGGQKSRMLVTVRQAGFSIDAGIATAGTGNLELDGLYLIPRAEGFAYATAASGKVLSGSAEGEFSLFFEDNGQTHAELRKVISGPDENSPLTMQLNAWGVPLGLRQAGKVALVTVYQDSDRHRLGDLMNMFVSWVGRYSRLG